MTKDQRQKTNNQPYVAIMAGGVGSRFWPASREARPKQFLDILGVGKSLIRLTFERFLKLTDASRIYIVTNADYKALVLQHLPELKEDQILCEPSRNNTAPCIAYTAFKLRDLDPEANFVVAPSDHVVLKEEAFLEKIREALAFTAVEDALCTLGIQPTRPDTGYGYIKYEGKVTKGHEEARRATKDSEAPGLKTKDQGPKTSYTEGHREGTEFHGDQGPKTKDQRPYKVLEFKEKPDEATARAYLESGNYLWNAGIFIWRAEAVLEAFRAHARQIYDTLASDAYNSQGEQAFIDENYPKTEKISVDYAILERAKNVYTIPADIGWSDLGTWASLHAELDQDADGNVVQGKKVYLQEVKDSLVRVPEEKRVVVRGLEDYIIVDEDDVLLIWPKSKEQEIKQVQKKFDG